MIGEAAQAEIRQECSPLGINPPLPLPSSGRPRACHWPIPAFIFSLVKCRKVYPRRQRYSEDEKTKHHSTEHGLSGDARRTLLFS